MDEDDERIEVAKGTLILNIIKRVRRAGVTKRTMMILT